MNPSRTSRAASLIVPACCACLASSGMVLFLIERGRPESEQRTWIIAVALLIIFVAALFGVLGEMLLVSASIDLFP